MSDPMIQIEGLHVSYDQTQAVRGLNLTIARGEIFGLLGPNGAGKSTTLACIQGLRAPTAGRARVDGYEVARDAARIKPFLGVQLQHTALFPELTATQLVRLFAALYNRFPSKDATAALLRRFGLAHKAKARPSHLSGGQRQRLALLLAVVNDPRVVLLDEPTTGLDPQARHGVWSLIRQLQREGRTVVLTTHAMEEAQELCDRVGIIERGQLIALGTPQELIRQHAPPLPPELAARRQAHLEDVFLALTGRALRADPDGSDMFADGISFAD